MIGNLNEEPIKTMVELREMVKAVPMTGWYSKAANEGPPLERRHNTAGLNSFAVLHFEAAIKQKSFGFDKRSEYYDQDLSYQELKPPPMNDSWKPYYYQVDAVCMMLAGNKARRGFGFGNILTDDMGPGKALEILLMIAKLRSMQPGEPVLLVMPKSLFAAWQKQIRQWIREDLKVIIYDGENFESIVFTDYDIIITNYERVALEYTTGQDYWLDMNYSMNNPHPLEQARMKGKGRNKKKVPLSFVRPSFPLFTRTWVCIVFDEAQRAANHKSATSKGCCALKAKCKQIVTGRPIPNDYSNMYALFKLLNLAPFNNPKWFREHFMNTKKTNERKSKHKPYVKKGEVDIPDCQRNAVLFLHLQFKSIRRLKTGFYEGVSLARGVQNVTRHTITLDLDDGTRYNNFFHYGRQHVQASQNKPDVLARVDEFMKFERSTDIIQQGDGSRHMERIHTRDFHPRTEQKKRNCFPSEHGPND